MKKRLFILTIIFTIALVMTSCKQKTTKFDGKKFKDSDITYVKDHRTGLCYGIVAARKTGDTGQTGIGITCVPCEPVEQYIEN